MRLPAAIAVSVMLCPALTPNASADPNAYQIFDRTRRVLQAQPYPDPIFFRTTIRVSEGARDQSEHFRAEAFSSGDVRIEGVSDEEAAAPHESNGVDFKLAFSIGWNSGTGGQTATAAQDVHRREASPDYLGVPLISPSYAFGLSPEREEASEPSPLSASNLPTIAHAIPA